MAQRREPGRTKPAGDTDPREEDHAGRRLGLPETGRGSLAGWGARITALLVDWLLANLAALGIVRDDAVWQAPVTALDFLPLALFGLQVWLMTGFPDHAQKAPPFQRASAGEHQPDIRWPADEINYRVVRGPERHA